MSRERLKKLVRRDECGVPRKEDVEAHARRRTVGGHRENRILENSSKISSNLFCRTTLPTTTGNPFHTALSTNVSMSALASCPLAVARVDSRAVLRVSRTSRGVFPTHLFPDLREETRR